MSNISQLFFAVILIFLGQALYSQPNQAWEEAEALFAAEQYSQALPLYAELLRDGQRSELLLYRLAYLYEQSGDLPRAIHSLWQLDKDGGGKSVRAKIQQLISGQKGYVLQAPNRYYRFWQQYQIPLLATLLSLLLLATFVIFRSQQAWRLSLGGGLSMLVLLGSLMWSQSLYFEPEQAVIITPTSFYSQPAYASQHRIVPLGPGSLVHIEDRHDLWCKVAAGPHKAWIPAFSIERLH